MSGFLNQRRRDRLCFALTLTLAGIISTFGFVRNFDAQGNAARWDSQAPMAPTNSFDPSTKTIRFFLADDGFSETNREAELNSIRAAFGQWQSVPGSSIRFEDAGTIPKGVDINTADGTNVVFWAKNSAFINGGRDNISGTLALTYRRVTNDNVIVESDIVLNGLQANWFADYADVANPGEFIESSVLHEIGHLLGLEHSPVGGATMFARSTTGVGAQAGLSDDELAAARAVYPALESAFGSLSGRVSMNSNPVFGAAVLLENASGNIQQGTVTRAGGAYVFPLIFPGEYTLRIAPFDPISGDSLAHLVTGSDIAPAYAGAQIAFTPVDLGISIRALETNQMDVQVSPNAPIFRITRVVTPASDPSNFRAINAPVQLRPGSANIFVGVCSTNSLPPNAILSVSGNDLSMGPTISHAGAFASGGTILNLLYATIAINANATPGLRSFIVSDGTNVSHANGFLEILPVTPDFNFDGLDDRFQRANFPLFTSAVAGPGADPDGDRADNETEFFTGTNPRDAAFVLKIERISFINSKLVIQWQSVPGKVYRLAYADAINAQTWTSIAPEITATNSEASWTEAASLLENRFYRIELVK